jgi:hypothetical protein
MTLQQIIDERISFLKEQINPNNKAEANSTFQIQIDVIRSVNDNIENYLAKKALLKNCKDFLASQMSINVEPFQITDISTQPLGPTNYTDSNTAACKHKVVDRVQTLITKARLSSVSFKKRPELDTLKGEQERFSH